MQISFISSAVLPNIKLATYIATESYVGMFEADRSIFIHVTAMQINFFIVNFSENKIFGILTKKGEK